MPAKARDIYDRYLAKRYEFLQDAFSEPNQSSQVERVKDNESNHFTSNPQHEEEEEEKVPTINPEQVVVPYIDQANAHFSKTIALENLQH